METKAIIDEWIKASKTNINWLLPEEEGAGNMLSALQITEKSVLGFILHNSAGVIIADGWLRLLGGQSHQLCPSISSWNRIPGFPEPLREIPGCLICAYDAIGGFFAINGGAFLGDLGNIFYFGPDTLTWDDLQQPYSTFVQWSIAGEFTKFYDDLLWADHADMTRHLCLNQAISLWPPPWSKEGKTTTQCAKKIVPLSELWDLHNDFAIQLGVAPRTASSN